MSRKGKNLLSLVKGYSFLLLGGGFFVLGNRSLLVIGMVSFLRDKGRGGMFFLSGLGYVMYRVGFLVGRVMYRDGGRIDYLG